MTKIEETLSSDAVIEILRQYDREGHIQASPRPGHIRVLDNSNDVTCAIENMGGIDVAAKTLGVSTTAIHCWIDEHFVPEPFASEMRKHTGYSIWSIQQSTFYVVDEGRYWPHTPTRAELNRKPLISIYRRLPVKAELKRKETCF